MDEISEKNEFDPLLECLVIFTELNNRPYSAEALTAGLPTPSDRSKAKLFSIHESKGNFSRAAKRAGFVSRLVRRELDEISALVMPCILMLKKENACILVSVDEARESVKVILPEVGNVIQEIPYEELAKEYAGFAFYIKKELRFDERELKKEGTKKRHWFFGTLKYSRDIYRDIIIASLLINLFVLATPLFTMNVYDRVVPNNAIDTLWILALGVSVIYIFDMVIKLVRTNFLEIAAKKSDIIMSSILFEKTMDLRMKATPDSVGSYANKLTEFESIRSFLTSSTLSLLIDLPFVFIFLLTVYYVAGPVVIIPVITIIIILAYTFSMRKTLQESIESTYKASTQKNSMLIETLSSLETIKYMGAAGHVQWKWEELCGDIADKSVKSKALSASINTITSVLIQLNTVAVVIAGVYLIKEVELTLGGLIAAVILSSRMIAPMGQVAALAAHFQHTKTAYENLNEIMQLPVEREEGKKFIERHAFRGDMEFKNVNFTYPESLKSSLNDVSLKIKAGEKVGIIGRIGSGKSTLQKLLLGLYAADSGSILVDGIDINQIDPADLRKNIGYVPQDIVLFKGSVKDNIILKHANATDEMILRAAEISGVIDFVNRHPSGFDMPVGERGRELSGGQRQSLAVARAFIQECPIVLMDEPSNQMDNSTESRLINRLKVTVADKTLVLVTHKMSLLALVDRLIVMDEGRVVLDGPKDEVLAKLATKGGQDA